MHLNSRRFRAPIALGLLTLALLGGCVPGKIPSPAATALAKPGNATVASAAKPALGTPTAAAASASSATAASAVPATVAPTAVVTVAPSQPPTPAASPTLVLGVKNTNVLDSVQLVRVIDGATIEVSMKGKNYIVRYLGIEVPAGGASPAAWEAGALAGNKKLLAGQALRLEKDVSDTDSEGRLLRYVYTKTSMVNAEMVRFGYARAVTQAPDTRYHFLFDAMQEEAKAAKRGLWATAP